MNKTLGGPLKIISPSAGSTKAIGRSIGRSLLAGHVVCLSGELGAGKTTLVKGIAEGLGAKSSDVGSPTFVLTHEYKGREKIYHLDWYRLDRLEGDDAAEAAERLNDAAVSLVEWPERGKTVLPKQRIEILLKHAGGDKRTLSIGVKGPALKPWLSALRQKLKRV